MQASHHEDRGGSFLQEGSHAQGLLQAAGKVVNLTSTARTISVQGEEFEWIYIQADALLLTHQTYLMLLQGFKLTQLFPSLFPLDILFRPYAPPPRLEKLRFGYVPFQNPKVPMHQVLIQEYLTHLTFLATG